eukprot:403377330
MSQYASNAPIPGMDILSKSRKIKYELRKKLRLLDLEKTQYIDGALFELEAHKEGMTLNARDIERIKNLFRDPKRHHLINYESAVKALIPILNESKQVKWVFQQEFTASQGNLKQNLKQLIQHPLQTANQQLINSSSESFNRDRVILSKNLFHKVLQKRQITELDSFVARDLSCANKNRNIYKNTQNKLYIKASNSNQFDSEEREQIRQMLKREKIDIKQLQDFKLAFLQCDSENTGLVLRNDFLQALLEKNKRYRETFLNNYLDYISIQGNDAESEKSKQYLSYSKLMAIIDIFMQFPSISLKESNNSNHVKESIEFKKDLDLQDEKLDKLVKYVHIRVEEKFKDFRHAFRSIDKNFDGKLSFKEFIEGLEGVGVKFSLEDFTKLFQHLDHDNQGLIDFSKFCMINTDKLKGKQYVQTLQNDPKDHKMKRRPPLPSNSNLLQPCFFDRHKNSSFANGSLPKNKDLISFSNEIQDPSKSEIIIKARRQPRLPSQKNKDYMYGSKNFFDHDIDALISNQYQDEQGYSFKIKKGFKYLKTSITPQNRTPTNKKRIIMAPLSQKLREDAVKKKYLNFLTSTMKLNQPKSLTHLESQIQETLKAIQQRELDQDL